MRLMRTALIASFVLAGATLLPARVSGQAEHKLQVSFNAGKVTVIARNVTLREILTEWARQGGCQFVNADKLTGGVLPVLQFEDAPELMVLASLLGPVSGYIVGGRRAGTTGASQFETVYIVPTSHATAPAFTSSGPIAAPLVTPAMPEDEIPPVTPIPSMPNGRGSAPAGQPNAGQSAPAGGVGAPVVSPPAGGRTGGPGVPIPSGPGRGGGR